MLETDIVDTSVERSLTLNLITKEQGTRLGHHLAKDNTRDHRIIGEMTLQKELIATHMVCTYGIAGGFTISIGNNFLFEAIDKQHRCTMREEVLDFFSVHMSKFSS